MKQESRRSIPLQIQPTYSAGKKQVLRSFNVFSHSDTSEKVRVANEPIRHFSTILWVKRDRDQPPTLRIWPRQTIFGFQKLNSTLKEVRQGCLAFRKKRSFAG